ncbi:hypothetical protein H2136_05520 [Aeromonas hydrophila]|uniref:Uncharacterized protein n=1 Tax=Aeromonas hydrophila TaxID=644 RepID=A0A926FJL7_AERHY|nr:hypothetical protein [Aeromonas hydrophila]
MWRLESWKSITPATTARGEGSEKQKLKLKEEITTSSNNIHNRRLDEYLDKQLILPARPDAGLFCWLLTTTLSRPYQAVPSALLTVTATCLPTASRTLASGSPPQNADRPGEMLHCHRPSPA